MAKSGVVENHTLVAQGVLKIDNGDIYLTEVMGVGDIKLDQLLWAFNEESVKISVAKKTEMASSEEENEE